MQGPGLVKDIFDQRLVGGGLTVWGKGREVRAQASSARKTVPYSFRCIEEHSKPQKQKIKQHTQTSSPFTAISLHVPSE